MRLEDEKDTASDDDALTMATSFELYWFVSSAQRRGGRVVPELNEGRVDNKIYRNGFVPFCNYFISHSARGEIAVARPV